MWMGKEFAPTPETVNCVLGFVRMNAEAWRDRKLNGMVRSNSEAMKPGEWFASWLPGFRIQIGSFWRESVDRKLNGIVGSNSEAMKPGEGFASWLPGF
jgi:hypothetical protein